MATAIAGEQFAEGLVSQLELNDTILSQNKAERLYLKAVYDCIVADAGLKLAIGNLRSRLEQIEERTLTVSE